MNIKKIANNKWEIEFSSLPKTLEDWNDIFIFLESPNESGIAMNITPSEDRSILTISKLDINSIEPTEKTAVLMSLIDNVYPKNDKDWNKFLDDLKRHPEIAIGISRSTNTMESTGVQTISATQIEVYSSILQMLQVVVEDVGIDCLVDYIIKQDIEWARRKVYKYFDRLNFTNDLINKIKDRDLHYKLKSILEEWEAYFDHKDADSLKGKLIKKLNILNVDACVVET